MDTKTVLSMLVRTGLKALAGFLIGHGYLQASGTEAFIGAGMAVAAAAWSFWNDYGSIILRSELEMLKVRAIQRQAAQGQPAAVKAPSPNAAVVMLIAGAAILALLCPGAAYAAGPLPRAAPTGNPITDIGNAINGQKQAAAASRNAGIDDLVSKLDKLALPDFEFALAQAQASKNDVTIPCWQAWVDLIKARQAAAIDASGQPIPVPDPHVITAIERISELLAILRPDSKISLACVQIAATAGKDVGTVITGILSGGALGMFKLPIPIGPIP